MAVEMTKPQCQIDFENFQGEAFSKACTKARLAVLVELARRYKAKDRTVTATPKSQLGRWHHPQLNYFVGEGTMKCPICPNGVLTYRRDAYAGHVTAYCSFNGCVNWIE